MHALPEPAIAGPEDRGELALQHGGGTTELTLELLQF